MVRRQHEWAMSMGFGEPVFPATIKAPVLSIPQAVAEGERS